MRKTFDPAEERQIVNRYRAGESTYTISKSLGASAVCINDILRKFNIRLRHRNAIGTDEQREIIIDTCLSGGTAAEASERSGISVPTVFAILKEEKISLSHGPAHKFSPDERAEMAKRYVAGESVRKIASAFGAGNMTIHKILGRAGVLRKKESSG